MSIKCLNTSVVHKALTQHLRLRTTIRSFTATGHNALASEAPGPPESNQPASIAKEARSDTPSTNDQSNASQQEHKSGDDHPAKQPDPQTEPTKSTGFGGQSEVKGGKDGLE